MFNINCMIFMKTINLIITTYNNIGNINFTTLIKY